jgi:hypothetical protein
MDFLGSAAFSQAVQALDIASGSLVCLKIIKNNKDYLDQSLDEIKLLRYVNGADPGDESGIVRLYDFFYYRVRLAGGDTGRGGGGRGRRWWGGGEGGQGAGKEGGGGG